MTGTPDLKCAAVLFAAADRDLMTVRSMTADAPIESIGFHLQQAAEKGMKAWLAALGETYPLTHNLGTLLGLLSIAALPSNFLRVWLISHRMPWSSGTKRRRTMPMVLKWTTRQPS